MKQALLALYLLFGFNVCSIASIPVSNATEEQTAKFSKFFEEGKVDQDNAQDQFNLFIKYLNGTGVPENKKLAVEWCIKSAKQGYEDAQYFLGRMYYYGDIIIIPENKKLAFEWFNKAAEQGNIGAQSHLGYMYSKGEGVTADNKYAYAWYSVQFVLDDSKYTKNQRDSVATKLSSSGLEEAQDIATKLYDKINSNK
ncbi:sel1 repeat family protein [Colwellia sp. BRX10-6]|uniref:tetratricopeptide repeat protein n=1 Tax=unclassified Colwellia TaxID=196834 RepID=UPI0015F4DD18|nr:MULTISPECIES: tetratricopeptide repeat protein [unclassified Colwellia]MBA6383830.1 sel1 repeat family protein [Colwellia sp. BRX10-9]MBA6395907.1 sel1 repeat family protein [Colwellia sp. BRX10-6]